MLETLYTSWLPHASTARRTPLSRARRYGGWGPRHGRSWVAAQGVALAAEPQAWGGPSDWSAYECRAGCSCPFGGGPWPGCADRRRAAGAADAGACGGHRLAAVTARTGEGDL